MGIAERQTFMAQLKGRGGAKVKLEARTRTYTTRRKSWTWLWNNKFLKPNSAGLTAPVLAAGSKPAKRASEGGIPSSKSPPPITGRRGSPPLGGVGG
jgi:hypothetical protein